MPNPALVNKKSAKIDHHLKIVDTFIAMGCPFYFEFEPSFGEYNPDAYVKDANGNYVAVEVQLTQISHKKMAQKLHQFMKSYGKYHQARIFLIVANHRYKDLEKELKDGFYVRYMPVPNEPTL